MCGVCAGRPGKTRLGDVVAADRLFFHDAGKQLPSGVERDLTTYKLRDDWKVALERFDPTAQFRDAAWLLRRPLTTEWREHRALIALRNGVAAPWDAIEPELGAHAWAQIVEALRQRNLLAASGRELTNEGRRTAGAMSDTKATWRSRVAAWRASGKTAEEFSASQGFAVGTLRWWSSRLRREGTPASVPAACSARASTAVRFLPWVSKLR
jgi:hypothetical protein